MNFGSMAFLMLYFDLHSLSICEDSSEVMKNLPVVPHTPTPATPAPVGRRSAGEGRG